MAKSVSEEDLLAGLKSVGGFGGLTRARADSPFRDSRAEPKTIDLPPRVEAKPEPVEQVVPPVTSVRSEIAAPILQEPRPEKIAKPKTKPKASPRKADIYTERVTIQMSPEMRDEVDELARTLQRSKTSKDERITSNTVMRVAIRFVLHAYESGLQHNPNTEEELFDDLVTQLKAR